MAIRDSNFVAYHKVGEHIIDTDNYNILGYIYCDGEQGPPNIHTGWFRDTKQSKCYDNTNEIIPCPSPEQAFYGQDAQYRTIQLAYKDNNDGTVSDLITGLMWQQSDDGVTRTWQQACDYCESLTLPAEKYSDWRLPYRRELMSIVNYGYKPAGVPPINNDHFPTCRLSPYWTGSGLIYSPVSFWYTNFSKGSVHSQHGDSNCYVRCVRGEPLFPGNYVNNGDTITDTTTGLMWQRSSNGETRTWEKALSYCEDLSLAGRSNWRLPNIRELESIVDDNCWDPATNPAFIFDPDTDFSKYFWSSSTHSFSPTYAWLVAFHVGFVGYEHKGANYYTRCVCSNVRIVSLPVGYTTVQENHSQIDQGQTHWYDFMNDTIKNLLIKLGFGSSFNIKIYKPDGTLYDEQQSDVSPIEVYVPNAQIGQWHFEITAIETPYQDDPYVLAIGMQKKTITAPIIFPLLLN